jgi:type 1 glutamine amidotransferase
MKRCLSVPCTVLSACLIALAPALVADTAPARISVLIVDGQNNHDWRADTPVLRGILEDTGRFTVEIATSPEQGEDMSGFSPEFRLYDAVLMNYNGDAWPETTRRAWTDYVRNGGGAVFVHAADNAFADWPEWNRMIGIGGWGGRDAGSGPYVYWENGRTVIDPSDGPTSGHGRIHDFEVVVRDAAHPITAGLPECWLHRQDELYHYLRGPATDLTLLATAYSDPETGGTGRHEPVLLVTEFGRGRAFHTMLGHDGKAMAGIGFQTTLARGTEWAATGTVTLPVPTDFPAVLKPLEALRLYTETSPREPLIQLETELYALAGDTGSLAEYEQAFLPILTSPETSAAARRFVCLHLAWMGTNRSVPALAGLLAEPGETRNHAIYALSDIPGPEADAALLNGLTMADTDAQKAVINAIGQRRIRGSAPLLRLCLKEPPLAALALRALAKLGTVEAFSVLEDDTRWKRDPAAAEALLSCAHALDPVPDDITRPLQRAVRYLVAVLGPEPALWPGLGEGRRPHRGLAQGAARGRTRTRSLTASAPRARGSAPAAAAGGP